MEWSDLRIFLTAVRTGSYLAAGRALGINRTTVGRRIDALEQAVGRSLFLESPAGPEPSREGRILLAAAARIEDELDRFRSELDAPDAMREPVRLVGSAGIVSEFLPEIADYQLREPGAAIEIVGSLDPLDALSQRRADLAIALVRVPPRRLAGVHVGSVAQAEYGLRGRPSKHRLGWGREIEAAIPGQWTVANPIDPIPVEAGIRLNNGPQLRQAVLAGLGRAALWCFAADAEPRLERLSDPDPRFESPLWLLYRSGTPPAPRLMRLMTFLEEAIRRRIKP
jgi:DNA-binding transcriptional LysR family regulator